jgi:nucleotide-binding universal stress UspA family protein
MIRKILVPLDGSGPAERALPHAALLARVFDARVLLLQVLPRSPARGGSEPVDPLAWRLARATAETYLSARAAGLEARGIQVATEVQEGVPCEVIVSAIRRGRHHLVVLASHGEGCGSHFSIGGTALSILLNAGVSTMLIPAGEEVDAESPVEYRRILAPVDCSPRGDWALGIAAHLARLTGARLLVPHVVTVPEVVSRLPDPDDGPRLAERIAEMNRKDARVYLEQMRERLGNGDLVVEPMVLEGPSGVVPALDRLARSVEPDLLVLSAHGRSAAPESPFGGTAGKLLLDGGRPILVLQDMVRSSVRPQPAPRLRATYQPEV